MSLLPDNQFKPAKRIDEIMTAIFTGVAAVAFVLLFIFFFVTSLSIGIFHKWILLPINAVLLIFALGFSSMTQRLLFSRNNDEALLSNFTLNFIGWFLLLAPPAVILIHLSNRSQMNPRVLFLSLGTCPLGIAAIKLARNRKLKQKETAQQINRADSE